MAARLQPRPLASLPTDKLSTGDPVLDAVLGGGLPCGSLTEIAGEAAASKTQLSLQLLLTVQLPRQYGGLEGSAIYVYTEGEPAMRRLSQLARSLHFRYPPEALAALPHPEANVFIEKGVGSGADLLRRLQRLRGLLDQQRRAARAAVAGSGGSAACSRPVRLLVVDSVAHVFRDMGDHVGVSELAGRTETLFKISALLRRYADEYGLAVLLVNQVVDVVGDTGDAASLLPAACATAATKNTGHTGGLRLESLGREVVPALGLAWANCINTRLFLSRCGSNGADPTRFHGMPSAAGGGPPALRTLQVVCAPHLPQRQCFYVVEATGVRGLTDEEMAQHGAAAAAAAAQAARQQQQQQHEAWGWQQRPAMAPPQQQQQQQQGWQPQHAAPQGWQQQQHLHHQGWQHQPLQHAPQQVSQQQAQQRGELWPPQDGCAPCGIGGSSGGGWQQQQAPQQWWPLQPQQQHYANQGW